MDFLASFAYGHNVVFTVPVLFVALFILMQVVGFNLEHLLGAGADADADVDADVDLDMDGGFDADVDADVDVDVDVDMDVDADIDGDVDLDAHVDMDADAHVDGGDLHMEHGLFLDVLAFFNLGKVPVMLIMEILFLSFGLTGVIFNYYGVEKLPFQFPLIKFWLTIPLAAVVSILITKTLTELMATYIPTSGKQALRARDLEGKAGEVVSVQVDGKYGRVIVVDEIGQSHMVHCMMMEGEPPVPKGGRVILVSFEGKTNMYKCSAASPHAQ